MDKNRERRQRKYKEKYCKFCDKRITSSEQFCDDDCEIGWKKRNEAKIRKPGDLSCMYRGCQSDLPIILAGRFCSEFCMNAQKNIDRKKNDELEKHKKRILKEVEKMGITNEELKNEEIKVRMEAAIKEIDKLVFYTPVYIGKMEQASNLFGVVDVPRTCSNTVKK